MGTGTTKGVTRIGVPKLLSSSECLGEWTGSPAPGGEGGRVEADADTASNKSRYFTHPPWLRLWLAGVESLPW